METIINALARCIAVMATMPVRFLNLVVPLPSGTEKRIRDTTGTAGRSRAIASLIGHGLRLNDVTSTNRRSTQPTTRGTRTLTMASRTTTTRTTRFALAPSADLFAEDPTPPCPADFSFEELAQAYFDCRANKRNSASALAFELNLETNLAQLDRELREGRYRPGPSICFVVTHPKPREVWAAEFRDRIVHHLLYNKIADRFHRRFIVDSCACIPGRGTLYAAERLEAKIRSVTHNWSRPAYYLKCDLANFFVSIDKRILQQQLAAHIPELWWRELTDLVLWHDPRDNHQLRGRQELLKLVPPHKRLTEQPGHRGLPIGNLSSQFFANVYLNTLDQFVKHRLKAKHYIRYVDDFVILDPSAQRLNNMLAAINTFLPARLNAHLNPKKTVLQPIARGVDFVGQVIKPWHRVTRRKTVRRACHQVANTPDAQLRDTANSYFGLIGQATHSRQDRAKLAKALMNRGRAVNQQLTQIYL